MLIVCKKKFNQNDCMDYEIIITEGQEKVFWWGAWIVVNVLKFNRN
jgi:hypothetical protein